MQLTDTIHIDASPEPKPLEFQPGEYTTMIAVEFGKPAVWYLAGFGLLVAIGVVYWIKRARVGRSRS